MGSNASISAEKAATAALKGRQRVTVSTEASVGNARDVAVALHQLLHALGGGGEGKTRHTNGRGHCHAHVDVCAHTQTQKQTQKQTHKRARDTEVRGRGQGQKVEASGG
jgi:hypothetical protein